MAKGKRAPGEQGPTSLFLLTDDNPIRRQVRWIIEWPVFEYGVIVTIIANCVVLAMEEHLPGGDRTPLAQQLVSSLSTSLSDCMTNPIYLCTHFIT